MSLNPSNTANGVNCYENESIIDESSPLITEETVAAHYVGAAIYGDEEAQCLPDKPPKQETPKDVAGVISILLLGTRIPCFNNAIP